MLLEHQHPTTCGGGRREGGADERGSSRAHCMARTGAKGANRGMVCPSNQTREHRERRQRRGGEKQRVVDWRWLPLRRLVRIKKEKSSGVWRSRLTRLTKAEQPFVKTSIFDRQIIACITSISPQSRLPAPDRTIYVHPQDSFDS